MYIDEKRRHMDEVAGPSSVTEKQSSGEKGKEEVLDFKLASDIE